MKEDRTVAAGDLLSRAQSGDAPAFAALVRLYQRAVYSIALRMLSDRQKSEDLAQEVFLQLHRKLDGIESAAHLGFWLRKVTTNRAIDRLRREPKIEALALAEDSDLVAEDSDADPLLQRRLGDLVAQLPPAPRAVVLLRYQEDLDPLEIARTLDMPINTVKSHLKRSLLTLRAQLGGAVAAEPAGDALDDDPSLPDTSPST